MQIPHVFQIISLCEEGKGKKKHRQHLSTVREILSIENILETRGPSVSRESSQKSGFSSLRIICVRPPPPQLAATLFSRRVEVNKGILRVKRERRRTLEKLHLLLH